MKLNNCLSLTKNGPVISLKSKRQPTVASSTCRVEHIALATTTHQFFFLVQVLNGMNSECQCAPVKIAEDNQGAIALSKKPVCH